MTIFIPKIAQLPLPVPGSSATSSWWFKSQWPQDRIRFDSLQKLHIQTIDDFHLAEPSLTTSEVFTAAELFSNSLLHTSSNPSIDLQPRTSFWTSAWTSRLSEINDPIDFPEYWRARKLLSFSWKERLPTGKHNRYKPLWRCSLLEQAWRAFVRLLPVSGEIRWDPFTQDLIWNQWCRYFW